MTAKLAIIACAGLLAATNPAPVLAVACATNGSTSAKSLDFDFKPQDARDGLTISFMLGLTPATFPAEDIKSYKSPCTRGTFKSADEDFSVFGGDDDSPPRWASTGASAPIVFFAEMPRPAAALAWYAKYQKDSKTPANFKNGEMMYALTVAKGDERTVYGYFDQLPDDSRLLPLMSATLADSARLLAAFNAKTQTISFLNVETSP